ncbi:MAG: hypothetical protein ABSF12_03445 [Bryobacteraceae bacterium]|jgi:hypothetical protein
MSGIQFVTDTKGRKVAVQIDLKKYGPMLEDFWDGLISESRRTEKDVPFEKVKADLVKRGRIRVSAISLPALGPPNPRTNVTGL